jgi:hypothetical protein
MFPSHRHPFDQPEILVNEKKLAACRTHRGVRSEQPHRAFVWLVQSRQHLDDRRLSGTVLPEQETISPCSTVKETSRAARVAKGLRESMDFPGAGDLQPVP